MATVTWKTLKMNNNHQGKILLQCFGSANGGNIKTHSIESTVNLWKLGMRLELKISQYDDGTKCIKCFMVNWNSNGIFMVNLW